MHPGRDVFTAYRQLQTPLQVHFGKRGSWSHAVGVGDVTVAGPDGPLVLRDVLHVPELAGPFFL